MKLSPTMLAAIELAKRNGGKLIRHPGGFWAGASWSHREECAFTATVEALVKRGLLDYSDWKTTTISQFPIQATLTDSALTPPAPISK